MACLSVQSPSLLCSFSKRYVEGKAFMAGVNAEDLFEEGYTKEDSGVDEGLE